MKIMITGAAGGYGSYAVDYVRKFAPEAEIYGLVHHPDKAAALEGKGVITRVGDYHDYDSLRKAFEGIDRLLFVSVSQMDLQKSVVDAAKDAGVKFIAYTSIHDPQYSKFGLDQIHTQTEHWIEASGITHVFLRNTWYLEMAAPLAAAGVRTGVYPYYSGDEAKITFVLKRELAEAGARVITGEGYTTALELSSDPYTWKEIGEAAAKAFRKDVKIEQVERSSFGRELMNSGISDMGAMLAQSYQDYAVNGNNGESASSKSTIEQVLGHPLTSLEDSLKELIEAGAG